MTREGGGINTTMCSSSSNEIQNRNKNEPRQNLHNPYWKKPTRSYIWYCIRHGRQTTKKNKNKNEKLEKKATTNETENIKMKKNKSNNYRVLCRIRGINVHSVTENNAARKVLTKTEHKNMHRLMFHPIGSLPFPSFPFSRERNEGRATIGDIGDRQSRSHQPLYDMSYPATFAVNSKKKVGSPTKLRKI